MDQSDERSLTDLILDALVYAPIGLTLDAEELTPELARRGRQHAAAARQIGELAVKTGLKRLDDLLGGEQDEPADPAPAEPRELLAVAPERPAANLPDPSDLAIPDYDLLAASQVVKRLDALSPDELETIRLYESGSRDRRTILHKIARLQD